MRWILNLNCYMSWGMVSEKTCAEKPNDISFGHSIWSQIRIAVIPYWLQRLAARCLQFFSTRADDGSRCYWNVYDIFLSSSALVAVLIINKVCLVESAFWPFRPADKAGTNTEADCSYIDISTFTTYSTLCKIVWNFMRKFVRGDLRQRTWWYKSS